MSKYTTQLRWIIENQANNSELPITQQIQKACPLIFDFDFPIWNESYRPTLEYKILMHYFNKEIGFETVGLWKLYLNERLNLIMPYYNQLYKSTLNDYDFLTDIDLTETISITTDKTLDRNGTEKADYKGSGNNQDIGTDTVTSDTSSTNLLSDLPQTAVGSLNDYATNQENGSQSVDSQSNSNHSIASTANSTNNINRDEKENEKVTETHTNKRTGLTGGKSKQDLIMQFRTTILNIDKMVIDELHDLFMLIY